VAGPPGAAGGGQGRPGHDSLVREGRVTRIPSKGTIAVRALDSIRIETPGGGGFGREARSKPKPKAKPKPKPKRARRRR
jgi:N-methylhydantoinase B